MKDRATKAVDRLANRFPRLARVIKWTARVARGAWRMMVNGLRRIRRWLGLTLAALSALAVMMARRFVQGVITATAEAERFALTLNQVADSSEEARESMQWVRNFARETPFFTQEIVKSFNILRAVGVKDIREVITVAGDAAFAMQRDVSEVSMAFVSLLRRTWRRLGVDLDRTGAKVKITTAKMRIETEKNVGAIRAGLRQALEVTFGGLMKKAQHGWQAMVKILASEWWEFRVTIGEAGIFDVFKAGLSLTLQWIKKMREEGKLKEWAQDISKFMRKAAWWVVFLGFKLRRIIEWGQRAAKWLGSLVGLEIEFGKGAAGAETEEFFKKIDKLIASWGDNINRADGAAQGLFRTLRDLTAEEKTRLSLAKQYAGLTFENQRKIRQARDILKQLNSMDKERAQAQFDQNEELRVFVAGNKLLAEQFMPFLTKWIKEGLQVYGSSGDEINDILTMEGLIINATQERLDIERKITKELVKQGGALGSQLQRQQEIETRKRLSLTGGAAGAVRENIPGPFAPQTSLFDIAARAGLMAAAGAGARERERIEVSALQTTRAMLATLHEISINNKFDMDYIINVDPQKFAEDVEKLMGSSINEAKLKVFEVVQQQLRDVAAKARAAEARQQQVEAN